MAGNMLGVTVPSFLLRSAVQIESGVISDQLLVLEVFPIILVVPVCRRRTRSPSEDVLDVPVTSPESVYVISPLSPALDVFHGLAWAARGRAVASSVAERAS